MKHFWFFAITPGFPSNIYGQLLYFGGNTSFKNNCFESFFFFFNLIPNLLSTYTQSVNSRLISDFIMTYNHYITGLGNIGKFLSTLFWEIAIQLEVLSNSITKYLWHAKKKGGGSRRKTVHFSYSPLPPPFPLHFV